MKDRLAAFLLRVVAHLDPDRILDIEDKGFQRGRDSILTPVLPEREPRRTGIFEMPKADAFDHIRVLTSAVVWPGFWLQRIVIPPTAMMQWEEACIQVTRYEKIEGSSVRPDLTFEAPRANGVSLHLLRDIPHGTYVLVVRAEEPK